MSTHAFSYALNPHSGKVHLVAVTRGRIALSGEGCNVDDMSEPLRLISDADAWAEYRVDPASWCGVCLDDPRRSPGANEIDTGIGGTPV